MSSGYLDGFKGRLVYGWASPQNDDDPSFVEVTIDGDFAGRVPANRYREDLREAGVNGGLAAFRFEIPERFCDRHPHSVDVRHAGSATPLTRSPQMFQYAGTVFEERRRWCTKHVALNMIDRSAISSSLSKTRKLAVFATYHRHQSHLAYQRRLALSLLSAGFTVFIVHATDDATNSFSAFEPADCFTLLKQNVGYDFGSYATALILLEDMLGLADELILINDSVLQLTSDLWLLVQRLRAANADVVSCTESFERRYHLQSYLLWFGHKALRSPALMEFMAGYSFTSIKDQVIEEGELGLSQCLLAAGLKLKALYSYASLVTSWLADYNHNVRYIKSLPGRAIDGANSTYKEKTLQTLDCVVQNVLNGVPTNPTHFFWDILIESHDFPFIKRELIVSNPCSIPTYSKIAEYLAQDAEIQEEVSEMIRVFGGRLIPALVPVLEPLDGLPAFASGLRKDRSESGSDEALGELNGNRLLHKQGYVGNAMSAIAPLARVRVDGM